MAPLPLRRYLGPEDALVSYLDAQVRGLGDDRHVRLEAPLDQVACALGAPSLLVGDRRYQQVALELGTGFDDRLGGGDHRGDARLHIRRSAPVELPVHDLAAEWVPRPPVPRRHHVDVTIVEEHWRPTCPLEAGDDVCTPRLLLDQLDVEAESPQLLRDDLGAPPLAAGRVDARLPESCPSADP